MLTHFGFNKYGIKMTDLRQFNMQNDYIKAHSFYDVKRNSNKEVVWCTDFVLIDL